MAFEDPKPVTCFSVPEDSFSSHFPKAAFSIVLSCKTCACKAYLGVNKDDGLAIGSIHRDGIHERVHLLGELNLQEVW